MIELIIGYMIGKSLSDKEDVMDKPPTTVESPLTVVLLLGLYSAIILTIVFILRLLTPS